MIPVNPRLRAWQGERAYASLREVPEPIDLVDVFRRREAVPALVEEAIAVRAKTVWMPAHHHFGYLTGLVPTGLTTWTLTAAALLE